MSFRWKTAVKEDREDELRDMKEKRRERVSVEENIMYILSSTGFWWPRAGFFPCLNAAQSAAQLVLLYSSSQYIRWKHLTPCDTISFAILNEKIKIFYVRKMSINFRGSSEIEMKWADYSAQKQTKQTNKQTRKGGQKTAVRIMFLEL
jgi:hypothetical protein